MVSIPAWQFIVMIWLSMAAIWSFMLWAGIRIKKWAEKRDH